MKKTLLYLLIGTAVLIVAAIIGKKQGWLGKGKATKVAAEGAAMRTIIETVAANGKIYPEIEVKISSDVSGEIIDLFVKEGDTVKKGDLLVVINPDIYKDMLDRAGAAVSSSRSGSAMALARVSQAQANFETVEKNYNRNKTLYEQKVISDAEFENIRNGFIAARSELESALEGVKSAEYSVQSTEASFNEAQKNLKKTTIFAPMDGIVSKLSVERGERVVGTVQMTGTEIMRIADYNNMEARVDVSENDVLQIHLGDEAEIEIDAYINRKFAGKVTQIGSSATLVGMTATDQATNFTVRIRILRESYLDILAQNKFPFRPGMSATAEVKTEVGTGILTVPIEAVTTREKEDTTGAKKSKRLKEKNKDEGEEDKPKEVKKDLEEVVFIIRDGKAVMNRVKTGIQDDTYIHILSGIAEGDEVITAPFDVVSRKLESDETVEKVDKEELYESD